MSLRGQFFVLVISALVLSLSFEGVLACWHARLSVGTEMRTALSAGDQMVDVALISVPEGEANAYLARLVHSFDGNRHIRVALTVGKKMVAASTLAPPPSVPAWFSSLLQVRPMMRRFDLSSRGMATTLILATDPSNEIGEVWGQFRDGTTILSLFSLLVLGLLYLLMARVTAPLKKLVAGFDAVGSGDYTARVTVSGPRELSQLSYFFNRMAVRLGALEEVNHRLNLQMITIQEEERADLARDLHDEMAPFLFAMRIDAEAIESTTRERAQAALAARARAISEAISHIQQHVRSILKQLRPGGLADVGLVQAIANLAMFWQRHRIGVVIRLDIGHIASGFGEQTDAAIYRLVQEGLTNAVRHGSACEVSVSIKPRHDMIVIHVEDNGTGLPAAGTEMETGLGLRGMRERVAALGGTLTLNNRPDSQGAVIVAQIPREVRANVELLGAMA